MADKITAKGLYGHDIEIEVVSAEIDGLLITKTMPAQKHLGPYAITHASTGMAICHCRTKKLAKSVLAELLMVGNWKRTGEELVGDKEFAAKVQALIENRDGVVNKTKADKITARGST